MTFAEIVEEERGGERVREKEGGGGRKKERALELEFLI